MYECEAASSLSLHNSAFMVSIEKQNRESTVKLQINEILLLMLIIRAKKVKTVNCAKQLFVIY